LINQSGGHRQDEALHRNLDQHPHFEILQTAVGNAHIERVCRAAHHRTRHPASYACAEYLTQQLEETTLDRLAQLRRLAGRGLLRINMPHLEERILDGAAELLGRLDAIAMDLSVTDSDQEYCHDVADLVQRMNLLGFWYYDDIGCRRSPVDGSLTEKSILFVRHDLQLD
jgi:hypothetical protein